RRITLNKAMSNTPAAPAQRAEASVQTWVKSQQQLHPKPGHFSAAFNSRFERREIGFGQSVIHLAADN
ncbi:MAG: hypothetical protein ACK53U_15825, partial [Alphaproteobacteria bacterium]